MDRSCDGADRWTDGVSELQSYGKRQKCQNTSDSECSCTGGRLDFNLCVASSLQEPGVFNFGVSETGQTDRVDRQAGGQNKVRDNE